MTADSFPGRGETEGGLADRGLPRGAKPRAEPTDDRVVPVGAAGRGTEDPRRDLRADAVAFARAFLVVATERSTALAPAQLPPVGGPPARGTRPPRDPAGDATPADLVHDRGARGRGRGLPYAPGAPPDSPRVRIDDATDRDRAADVDGSRGDEHPGPGEGTSRREGATHPVPSVHALCPGGLLVKVYTITRIPALRFELREKSFGCYHPTQEERTRQRVETNWRSSSDESAVPRAASDGRQTVRPGGHADGEGSPGGPERAARDLRARGPPHDDAVHRMGAGERGDDDGPDASSGETEGSGRRPRAEGVWTEWDDRPLAPEDTADVL